MGDFTLGQIKSQVRLALGNRDDLESILNELVNTCQMRIARFFDFEEMLSLDDLTIAYTGVALADSAVSLPTKTRDVYGLTIVDSPRGPVVTVDSIAHQGNHADGIYLAVALTGGSGSAVSATVTVADNAVTSVIITAGGTGYAKYDTLTIPTAPGIGGASPVTCSVASVNLLDSTSNPGSYYTVQAVDRPTWKNKYFVDMVSAGTAKPAYYCTFSRPETTLPVVTGAFVEVYPPPDKEYTAKLRRSKWPANLNEDEDQSELQQKDDLIITLTICWTLYHLNNVERGNAYWVMFRSMVREAIDSQNVKPDLYQRIDTMRPVGRWTNEFDSTTGISVGNRVFN